MNVTLYELVKSRATTIDLRAGSTVFEFLALVYPPYDTGTDLTDLIQYAEANTLTRYGFQQRRTVDCKPMGGPVWTVTASYGFDEGDALAGTPGDLLPYEFSFDTTGGTLHITQSLSTSQAVRFGIASRTLTDVTTAARQVNDASATSGSPTITSDTAAFTEDDVGADLDSGTPGWLPAGTTLQALPLSSFDNVATMSDDATADEVDVDLEIFPEVIESLTANFTQADVGAVLTSTVAGWLPADATIASVASPTKAFLSGPVQGNLAVLGGALNLTLTQPAPTNFNRAIGVSKDGIAGTDKVAPKTEFQQTRNFSGVSLNYIQQLHLLSGTVNDDTFFGFAMGELLFLGASGAPSQNNTAAADPLVRVTFRFAASPNKTDIDLVPDDADGNHLLRVPEKLGWEYLWVFYVNAIDPVSRRNVPRPGAAYVEQVYDFGDFSQLRIGTG